MADSILGECAHGLQRQSPTFSNGTVDPWTEHYRSLLSEDTEYLNALFTSTMRMSTHEIRRGAVADLVEASLDQTRFGRRDGTKRV